MIPPGLLPRYTFFVICCFILFPQYLCWFRCLVHARICLYSPFVPALLDKETQDARPTGVHYLGTGAVIHRGHSFILICRRNLVEVGNNHVFCICGCATSSLFSLCALCFGPPRWEEYNRSSLCAPAMLRQDSVWDCITSATEAWLQIYECYARVWALL